MSKNINNVELIGWLQTKFPSAVLPCNLILRDFVTLFVDRAEHIEFLHRPVLHVVEIQQETPTKFSVAVKCVIKQTNCYIILSTQEQTWATFLYFSQTACRYKIKYKKKKCWQWHIYIPFQPHLPTHRRIDKIGHTFSRTKLIQFHPIDTLYT